MSLDTLPVFEARKFYRDDVSFTLRGGATACKLAMCYGLVFGSSENPLLGVALGGALSLGVAVGTGYRLYRLRQDYSESPLGYIRKYHT